MPMHDYKCLDCGQQTEVLVVGSADTPQCGACGSRNLEKLLSAHSSFAGGSGTGLPGPGDHTCCGQAPGAGSCAGPGSCCGKN